MPSVLEYLMTLLNSNFEDWRIANPTAPMDDFQFTTKKMGNSGSLFDIDKLKDVSKNTISVMSADEVYNEVTGWAKDYDQQLYTLLTADEQKAKAIFAIGRGGAKPARTSPSGARSRTTWPSSTTSCMFRLPHTRKMSPRKTPSPSSPSTSIYSPAGRRRHLV